jgi:zinc/manganese transport system ATP-binding protein
VHHLSGEIAQGTLLAVVGPNGAGKSTLLKGIVGVVPPLGGQIARHGISPKDIAYLPQIAEIDRSFPISVFDLVAMGLWKRAGLLGGIGKADREKIATAIDAVGLRGFEHRAIGTLSGGQMQRALFARLLLQDAQVILLDEPFASLDSKTVSDLLELVHRWHGEKRTVVAVLHDFEMVRQHFPEALLLARAPVAWGRTAETLSPENLLKARRMSEAFDEQAGICEDAA